MAARRQGGVLTVALVFREEEIDLGSGAVEEEKRSLCTDARTIGEAVGHGTDVVELSAVVDDVKLEAGPERASDSRLAGGSRVEHLTMLGRVQLLPAQPEVVLDACRIEDPLHAVLVRPREGQRLDLDRRKEAMNGRQVRSHPVGATNRLERSEDEA